MVKDFDHSPNAKANPHGVVSTKEKDAAIVAPKHEDMRLARVGESFMEAHDPLLPGTWQMHDEQVGYATLGIVACSAISLTNFPLLLPQVARRQVRYVGCMFHFRHWDDYSSTGTRTVWPATSSATSAWTTAEDKLGCMVRLINERLKAITVILYSLLLYQSRSCIQVLRIDKDAVMAFESCESVLNS